MMRERDQILYIENQSEWEMKYQNQKANICFLRFDSVLLQKLFCCLMILIFPKFQIRRSRKNGIFLEYRFYKILKILQVKIYLSAFCAFLRLNQITST